MWFRGLLLATMLTSPLMLVDASGPSVGTTLFRVQDIDKKCWSRDQLELLQYRHIFQDMIPAEPPQLTPQYLTAFAEYVHACLEETSAAQGAAGEGSPRRLLLSLAAADTLGGYLQHRLLPRARRAFYAGNIEHRDVCTLHELQASLRRLLQTDGASWRPPDCSTPSQDPSPEPLQLNATTAPPASRRGRRRRQSCGNPSCPGLVTYPRPGAMGSFIIPMPFLDDRYEPTSIALPLRPVSLYKLSAAYSTAIIAKYYVTAIKCLRSVRASKEEERAFNEHLYTRLVEEVVPRLKDNKLYAAFGAVLRVLETMVSAGVGRKQGKDYVLPAHLPQSARPAGMDLDYYKPRPEPPEGQPDTNSFGQFDVLRGPPAQQAYSSSQDVVVLAAVTAALLWLAATVVLGLCWCCARCCRRHSDPRAGFFYNVFVSIFYTLKESLSHSPSRDDRPPSDTPQQVPPMTSLPEADAELPPFRPAAQSLSRGRSSSISSASQPPVTTRPARFSRPAHGSSLRSSTDRSNVTTTTEDEYSDTNESEGQRTR